MISRGTGSSSSVNGDSGAGNDYALLMHLDANDAYAREKGALFLNRADRPIEKGGLGGRPVSTIRETAPGEGSRRRT